MKLGKMIKYSCLSVLKPLAIFYIIMYGIMTIIYLMPLDGDSGSYFGGMEFSCFIYLAIVGTLGFTEDFYMFIQNGFTRKKIFLANTVMFLFVSLIMSIIDITISHIFNIWKGYNSIFNTAYNSNFLEKIVSSDVNIITKILWYVSIYFMICCISYCCSLIINRIGKKIFWISFAIIILLIFMVIPVLVNFVFDKSFLDNIMSFIRNIFGLGYKGKIKTIIPILSFTTLSLCFSGISFLLIRRARCNR